MTRNVQAAVTSWIGGGANANWNTAANWVGGDLNVPMVVMIYDQGFSGWNPTTNYMAQGNITAQAAVQAGQAVGIIQYKRDKSDTSPGFPIIAQLYGQWAYQPKFASISRSSDENVSLAGNGGGPNIGYTLKAADTLSTSLASWATIAMGNFDTNGNFVATNTDERDAQAGFTEFQSHEQPPPRNVEEIGEFGWIPGSGLFARVKACE